MRHLSVDFYRGLTVAFMIIVNTPGTWDAVYAPLRHAEWHGCTPTDLVFPSFMFIIGVSMWLSFEKFGHQLSTPLAVKILRRTVILFAIGLILNNFPLLWKNWDTWRIMGVPQRLALGYCFASFICLLVPRRFLIFVAGGLLLLYWGLLHWLFIAPVGGPYDIESNAVLTLDRALFGVKHLWHGDRIPFDPEGVLSTLPAIVTVIFGWIAGDLIGRRQTQKDLLVRDLLVYGIALGFLGLAWDLFFPINKKLWTSSFVLYTGGISMILLAGSVWLIDIQKVRSGTGLFLPFGSNPLFAYVLSEALLLILFAIPIGHANAQVWIYETVFKPLGDPQFSSFLFALVYMLLCWLICRALYKRKIYIKL